MTTDPVTISSKNGHARCLLCGEENPLSLGVSFQRESEDSVCAHFRARPALQGYDGMLHGGIVAALLDAAMTHCLFHHGIQAVTGELHVRYTLPISCEAEIDIRAWLFCAAPPLYYLKAEILHEGQVSAWAEAKFMPREKLKHASAPGSWAGCRRVEQSLSPPPGGRKTSGSKCRNTPRE